MNVDSSKTKEASLGMVVRDHSGSIFLCVLTRVVNVESPLHAEIKAILFSLEEALNNSFLSLMIESDSLLAIQEIMKQHGSFYVWEGIISDIINLSLECSFCSFTHIRRSVNGFAHNLAKLCTELGAYKVWGNSSPPLFCNPDTS
ncbi:hypothetical protein CRYUN_Cryun15aG0056500 [Craigia yunnanensis]